MKSISILFIAIFLCNINALMAQSKKEIKKEEERMAFEAAKELIESKAFIFEATSCNTQKGRRIDLTTSINYLKIEGTTVSSDLPFFGYSQLSHYESSGGFTFVDEEVEYKIEYNDKKNKITIRFQARGETEVINFFFNVFSENSASLNATSTHRDFITYRGNLKPIQKEED